MKVQCAFSALNLQETELIQLCGLILLGEGAQAQSRAVEDTEMAQMTMHPALGWFGEWERMMPGIRPLV